MRFTLKKSQKLKYALNHHGATNVSGKATLVVPVSLEIQPLIQSGIRLGGCHDRVCGEAEQKRQRKMTSTSARIMALVLRQVVATSD